MGRSAEASLQRREQCYSGTEVSQESTVSLTWGFNDTFHSRTAVSGPMKTGILRWVALNRGGFAAGRVMLLDVYTQMRHRHDRHACHAVHCFAIAACDNDFCDDGSAQKHYRI